MIRRIDFHVFHLRQTASVQKTIEWSDMTIAQCLSLFEEAAFIVLNVSDKITDSEYTVGALSVQTFDGTYKDVRKCISDSPDVMRTDNFVSSKYFRLFHRS